MVKKKYIYIYIFRFTKIFKPSARRLRKTPYSINRDLSKKKTGQSITFTLKIIYLPNHSKQDLNPEL